MRPNQDSLPMEWDALLDDLENEQAVLFIGPELVQINGKSLGLQVREQLHRENLEDIEHHYRRDGIFLFHNDEGKLRAQTKIKRLYKQLPPDETLLQRVAALPFHLIISLSPDTHLLDIFQQCGLDPHFHYFRSGEPPESLPKPESGKPLIYNLVGHIGYDESLVLDYDDMFGLMRECLKTGLPRKINEQIFRARTFVFLGFDFEKWHTQMLLRFISESQRKGISKFAIEGERPSGADTLDFIVSGFKIRFKNGEQADETFFDSLYRHCEERNILRPLVNQYAGRQIKVMQLAYQGKIATAIGELRQELKGLEDQEEATLLAARLSALENEKDRTDSRDYWVAWNKVAYGVINLAKKLKP